MAAGPANPPPRLEDVFNPSSSLGFSTSSSKNQNPYATFIGDFPILVSRKDYQPPSSKKPTFAQILNKGLPTTSAESDTEVVDSKLVQFIKGSLQLKTSSLHQGKPAVTFKLSEKQNLIARLRHVLIAKFSHGRPPMAEIKKFLNHQHLQGNYIVSIFDSKHVMIECFSFADFTKIWIKRNWSIIGFPVRIFKWTEDFQSKKESTICPIWIHLPELPLYFFEEEALLSIANTIGKPLFVDKNNINRTKVDYASICVEFDVSRPHVDEIWIDFESDCSKDRRGGFWQKVRYNDIPAFCVECHHLGHSASFCKRRMETLGKSMDHMDHAERMVQSPSGNTQNGGGEAATREMVTVDMAGSSRMGNQGVMAGSSGMGNLSVLLAPTTQGIEDSAGEPAGAFFSKGEKHAAGNEGKPDTEGDNDVMVLDGAALVKAEVAVHDMQARRDEFVVENAFLQETVTQQDEQNSLASAGQTCSGHGFMLCSICRSAGRQQLGRDHGKSPADYLGGNDHVVEEDQLGEGTVADGNRNGILKPVPSEYAAEKAHIAAVSVTGQLHTQPQTLLDEDIKERADQNQFSKGSKQVDGMLVRTIVQIGAEEESNLLHTKGHAKTGLYTDGQTVAGVVLSATGKSAEGETSSSMEAVTETPAVPRSAVGKSVTVEEGEIAEEDTVHATEAPMHCGDISLEQNLHTMETVEGEADSRTAGQKHDRAASSILEWDAAQVKAFVHKQIEEIQQEIGQIEPKIRDAAQEEKQLARELKFVRERKNLKEYFMASAEKINSDLKRKRSEKNEKTIGNSFKYGEG